MGMVSKVRKQDEKNIPVKKTGRPSKVSKTTKAYLARQYSCGNLLTPRDGQQLIQSTQGVLVHAQSIRNYLRQEGLRAYVQPKKPDLTEDQIQKRYNFARDHLHWSVEQWRNVMFSDETLISRIGSFGRRYCYKRPGDKTFRAHQVQKTKQGGGGKMMIWGCITPHGVGDACRFMETLDSKGYMQVLKDYVVQSRDWCGMDRETFVFQHDNASVHTASIVKKYIRKAKINTLPWPPNSPDLNPIEPVWNHIKRELGKYREDPSTMDVLWERVQCIWETIPEAYISKLYESMPRRMAMLYKSKGGHIKY
jgi:transposase